MFISFGRIGRAAFAAAAGIALGASAASSAEIAKLRIGNWQGGAFSNDQNGTFSHCAASARYKSGITLVFSVSNNRVWSMGFSSSTWNLNRGSSYPVRYWVDNGEVLNGTAYAKTDKLAQVILPANSTLFGAFRYGQMLRVAAEQQTLAFRLTDTSELLNMLLQCSRDYGNYRAGGGNPFGSGGNSGGSSNPFGGGPAPAPSNPFGGGNAPRPAPADKKSGETI
ncbi:MAG TPA: hypothetical protein PKW21_07445 [Rhabdaerophilum sp.]|nr:hypothetical protein [Rhabdaerophilum sp.]